MESFRGKPSSFVGVSATPTRHFDWNSPLRKRASENGPNLAPPRPPKQKWRLQKVAELVLRILRGQAASGAEVKGSRASSESSEESFTALSRKNIPDCLCVGATAGPTGCTLPQTRESNSQVKPNLETARPSASGSCDAGPRCRS